MPKGEPQTITKYGARWGIVEDPVSIEMACIRRGGQWKMGNGTIAGAGLFFHYKALQKLLWPEDSHHRWSDLMLSEILANRITAIMGPKDSGKTHVALSKFGLTDYFCFPHNTLILISSTDIRGLELRVWGDLKTMFTKAKARYPWLPGHLLDSKHAIATDNLKEDLNRDMRKGVVCIPCMSAGGSWMGLGKYVGIKQVRRRLFGDELQFMKPSYIESLANLNSGDFKGVFVGNPLGEGDPLDKMAEPKDGWGTEGDVSQTTVWDNKFIQGRTINLVGTDSPNFEHSQDPTPKYPWMINRHSIEAVVAFYGMDSLQYYSQCLGIRRPGLNARRVISKMMCKKFKALEPAVWLNTKQTRIYAIDAAYGGLGGDRCIGIRIDFGFDVTGKSIIKVFPYDLIPVSVKDDIRLPEDQIADWVKKKCEGDDIPATHVFFDATGRGSLGTSFARLWSAYVNPVEYGGRPTERPVSTSLKVRDLETGQMRLKLCNEHYSKFVTELWYSVRYVIEAGQMRELPEEVMDEGCRREWKMVKGDKIEIETKEDMKERVNISPDLFDALATAIEGARRMGFVINSLDTGKAKQDDDGWKKVLKERAEKLTHGKALSYA